MNIDNSLNKVIAVTLSGGLGNQLFQYATGRALAIRRNAPLVMNVSWFEESSSISNVTPRKYALAPFSLPLHLENSQPVNRSSLWSRANLFGRISRRLGFKRNDISFVERSFRFDERVLNLEAPTRLIGYWQSPHYFSDVAAQIRQDIGTCGELTDACVEVLQKINATDAICIHVRRGDYVTNKEASSFHGLCSIDYYKRGVNRVAEGLESPHGFVFTDDPAWVRENLSLNIEFTVVDINSVDEPHLDLWLMSACKYFVIANSSLSWWGAWLSTAPNKQVIAPARWFTNSTIDTTDLIPAEWSRI